VLLLLLITACRRPPADTDEPPVRCDPRLVLSPDSVRADGEDVAVAILAVDPACDAAPELTSTTGEVTGPVRDVVSGEWRWEIHAGNVPGDALVAVTYGEERLTRDLTLWGGDPVSVQLHQHGPFSEGDTTHGFQTRQAQDHGVDVILWADHDYRYWYDWYHTPEWEYGDVLRIEDPATGLRASWWEVTGSPDLELRARLDGEVPLEDAPTLGLVFRGMHESNDLAWRQLSWETTGRRHYRPLLADVTVRFSIKPDTLWDPARDAIRVRLPLSQVAESDLVEALFVSADDRDPVPEGAVAVEMPALVPGVWNDVELDLTAWARDNLPEGEDLTLRGFQIEVGARGGYGAAVWIGGIHVEEGLCCDDLVARQRELLDNRYSGVVRHVIGQEISFETTDVLHFVAVGERLPWTDYDTWSLIGQPAEIVADVQENGGAVVFTHPFGVDLDEVPTEDPAALVETTCDLLDDAGVYGAEAIEVGYPMRVRPIADHMALWDCLLQRGELATGVGASDLHVTQVWTSYRNRYVTWLLPWDDGNEGLIDALRRGRAFFGDPTVVSGTERLSLDLVAPGVAGMGQVAGGLDGSPVRVELRSSGLDAGDVIVFVVDGVELASVAPEAGVAAVDVTPDAWTVVRAEVRGTNGTKLWTNPVILSTDNVPPVEEWRLARP
jgi:hypothetical protein